MAASGTLIARAGYPAHLDTLGVASRFAMATVALLTWRDGQALYRAAAIRACPDCSRRARFGLSTAATLLIAIVAIVVTIAI